MIRMISDTATWLPFAVVGTTFTTLGLIKIYGFSRGIVGGGCKPVSQRLCGSCPSWSRAVNNCVVALFLVIGLANLAYVAWIVWRWSRFWPLGCRPLEPEKRRDKDERCTDGN